jgi:hypothetical protein
MLFWLGSLWRLLGRFIGVRQASQQSVPARIVYEAVCNPLIRMEVDCGDNCHGERRQVHVGMAKLDPQTEYSLIGRRFAEVFFAAAKSTDLESAKPYRLVEGLEGGPVLAIKEVNARWACVHDPTLVGPDLRMDPAMVASTFHIMETMSRFDVIIGMRDIASFNLLGLKLPLAAASFRSQQYAVDCTCRDSASRLVADKDQ